jgi:hypothetical protein
MVSQGTLELVPEKENVILFCLSIQFLKEYKFESYSTESGVT